MWRIERLSPEPAPEAEYLDFLSRVPEAWIYATPAYQRLIGELLTVNSELWLARDQESGAIAASLPLMWCDGPWGRICNSLPFYGSHGGVLGTEPAARAALTDFYARHTESAAATTLIGHPWPQPEEALAPATCQDSRIGQLTRLAEPAALFDRFHYKTRNMIRKAQQSELEIRLIPEALSELAALHTLNMQAIGGQPKPAAFFEALPRYFTAGRDYQIYGAFRHGQLVSALLLLYFNGVVEYFTPAIEAEYRTLQPNSLLIWQAMQDAHAQGFKWWNWGGTWRSQGGVYQFKKRWGTEDYPYLYHVRINDRRVLKASPQDLQAAYPFFYVAPYELLGAET